jgi:hypothetical protein
MDKIKRQYGTHVLQKCLEKDGAVVVSIDINGKDGALPFDLQKPLPSSLGQFDIIINGGTSEHILNQDACFENIHNICKIDGLMFHIVPLAHNWIQHGFYMYLEKFFSDLAQKSKYSIVGLGVNNYVSMLEKRPYDLVFACLRKEYDEPFGGISPELLVRTKLWHKG